MTTVLPYILGILLWFLAGAVILAHYGLDRPARMLERIEKSKEPDMQELRDHIKDVPEEYHRPAIAVAWGILMFFWPLALLMRPGLKKPVPDDTTGDDS